MIFARRLAPRILGKVMLWWLSSTAQRRRKMLLLYSAPLNPALQRLQTHYTSVFSIDRSIQISALRRLVDPLSDLSG